MTHRAIDCTNGTRPRSARRVRLSRTERCVPVQIFSSRFFALFVTPGRTWRLGSAEAMEPPARVLPDLPWDIIERVAKGVPIHVLVRATEALKNTPALSNDVRSGCWRAACYELYKKQRASGLDSPKLFDALLALLDACLQHGPIDEDKAAEARLEDFSTANSSEARNRKAEDILLTYRSGFDPFVGTECVVRSCVPRHRRDVCSMAWRLTG